MDEEDIAENEFSLEVEAIKGERLPAGQSISAGELSALMDTCAQDQGPAGVRDAAIVALLYSCGLRRAELVGLDVEDYDAEARTLAIRQRGKEAGPKRGKERLAHAVDGAAAALADWLTIRGDAAGPLFVNVWKGGHLKDNRLTTQVVYHILQKRAAQAGIKDLSPHDFRRTFVGDLFDAGADMPVVQRLLGKGGGQWQRDAGICGLGVSAGHISSSNDVLGEEEFGRDLGRVEGETIRKSKFVV